MASPGPLLVLCALAAYLLQGAVAFPGSVREDLFECIRADFPEDHACRTLFPNHISIMAPNPQQIYDRAQTQYREDYTAEQFFAAALSEFDRSSLLVTEKDSCSDKIATLLCFFYFPSCHKTEVGKAENIATFPCRSLCEEITALDSNCTKRIMDLNQSWGPIFQDCNYTYGTGDQEKQVYLNSTTSNCLEQSHQSYYHLNLCKKLTNDLSPSCRSRCKFRNSTNKRIFDRNDYNFAISCTVNSIVPQGPFNKEAINCTVNKQFQVKSKGSCKEAPPLEVGESVLILGYNSTCTNCYSDYIKIGKDYIIAGTYVIREDCDTLFYALGQNDLILPSSSKRERKFEGHVGSGNKFRKCQ